MATQYGNTNIIPDKEPRTGNTKPNTSPIIDEENTVPISYEGNIIFNKTIYSKRQFESNIDTDFSELNTNSPIINVEEFFKMYNEIFFDLPKRGENSHTTIFETSRDYLTDYRNPLQDTVDSLIEQIETLSRENNILRQTVTEFETAQEQEELEEATQEATYLSTYGNLDDPTIKLAWLKTNLNTMKSRDQLAKSRNTYFNNIKEDLNNVGAVLGNAQRPASQWTADINGIGGSSNDKRQDLRNLVAFTKQAIQGNKYETTNAWKI